MVVRIRQISLTLTIFGLQEGRGQTFRAWVKLPDPRQISYSPTGCYLHRCVRGSVRRFSSRMPNDGGSNLYDPRTSGAGDRRVNHSAEINTVDASNASNHVAPAVYAIPGMWRSVNAIRFQSNIPWTEPQTVTLPYLTLGAGAQGTPVLRPQFGPNAQTCMVEEIS